MKESVSLRIRNQYRLCCLSDNDSIVPIITVTIHEQHCQVRDIRLSLSRGGLAILSTILSPSSSEVMEAW